MADVLHAEGILPVLPEFCSGPSRMELGLAENNCPACGKPRQSEAFKCASCNHIVDALKAYLNGAIEYGHVSFDTMTSDELDQADDEKTRREAIRAERQKRLEAKAAETEVETKAEGETQKGKKK